jgi:hypothetical protein
MGVLFGVLAGGDISLQLILPPDRLDYFFFSDKKTIANFFFFSYMVFFHQRK